MVLCIRELNTVFSNMLKLKKKSSYLLITIWFLSFVCVALLTNTVFPSNEIIIMSFGAVAIAGYPPLARAFLCPFLHRILYLIFLSIVSFLAYEYWLRYHFSYQQWLGSVIWSYQFGYALVAYSLFRKYLGREPERVLFSDKPFAFEDGAYGFASVMLGWVLPNIVFSKIVAL